MTPRAGVALLGLMLASAMAFGEPYLTGGAEPLPPELQSLLDKHRDVVALGINTEWMTASGIAIDPYIQAIDATASAVEDGRIPGAVVVVDRIGGTTLPALIGYQQTDPQKRRITRESLYYVQDMTIFLVTAPVVHYAVMQGKLKYASRVGELIPELAGSDKAAITVEMLLRHASGLPAEVAAREYASREELISAMAAWPLESTPGTRVLKSSLNGVLLGLMVENATGLSFSEYADNVIAVLYETKLSTLHVPPSELQSVAPGEYSQYLGRMAWAEPAEPIGCLLAGNAGHTGLAALPTEVAEACNLALLAAELEAHIPPYLPHPLATITRGNARISGGDRMGLGMEINRFEQGSFGWDSPSGSSVWIIPGQRGYIVYLSNADHPSGIRNGWNDPRDAVMPLLYRALSEGRIDTPEAEKDSPPTPSPLPATTP